MQSLDSLPSTFASFDLSAVEQKRYLDLRTALRPFSGLFEARRVLDFGASYGLSAAILIEFGASYVWGVEPEAWRVEKGMEFMSRLGIADRVKLSHVEDTRRLNAPDSSFGFILANAVFEHIAQPRAAYVRELWRLLALGGTLMVRETPNKYLPADFHTLHLPFTNWLPSALAHRIGTFFGRFSVERTDWESSGWRGMGYYEFVKAIPGPYVMEHEMTRPRHKLLRAVGLPSGLVDPWPVYLVRKPS
jgi:SAM-dependent methyltransferase